MIDVQKIKHQITQFKPIGATDEWNNGFNAAKTIILDLLDIDEKIQEEETPVCEMCNGTGEVPMMISVYPGEPHIADIDTQTCLCRLDNQEDYTTEE